MKKLEDYHWICPEPFANINTSFEGIPKPCCVMIPTDDLVKFIDFKNIKTVEEVSFDNYWNDPLLKRLKNAMKNGGDDEFLKTACSVCSLQEESGNRSHRQFYIDRFENDFFHLKNKLEKVIESDNPPDFLYSVELDHLIGNICNLSCAYCSPLESSSFDKESVLIGENTERQFGLKNKNNLFDKDLYKIFNMSEEIKFAGGEPLISKKLYEVIDMIESPEEKQIRVVTNGTKFVKKFLEKTKKFKKVTVNMSIEGVGEFNDYIRYPSKWDSVCKNINTFINSDINFILTPTHNAISLGKLHELCELFGNECVTTGSIVTNNFYSLRSIPPDIKEIYLNKLYHYGKYDVVKFAIKYLENAKFNETEMYSMLSHIKRRDKHRNMCLLNYVPEWEKYYNNIIETVDNYPTKSYYVDFRKEYIKK